MQDSCIYHVEDGKSEHLISISTHCSRCKWTARITELVQSGTDTERLSTGKCIVSSYIESLPVFIQKFLPTSFFFLWEDRLMTHFPSVCVCVCPCFPTPKSLSNRLTNHNEDGSSSRPQILLHVYWQSYRRSERHRYLSLQSQIFETSVTLTYTASYSRRSGYSAAPL